MNPVDIVEYGYGAVSVLVLFYSLYRLSYLSTHRLDDVRAGKLAEAKSEWKTESRVQRSYRNKMVGWYLTNGFLVMFLSFLWLFAIPVLMGRNSALSEKKQVEDAKALADWYNEKEKEAAQLENRAPELLDLETQFPFLHRPEILKKKSKQTADMGPK